MLTSTTFSFFIFPIVVEAFYTGRNYIISVGETPKVTALSVSLPNWFGSKDIDSTTSSTISDDSDLMQRTAKMMEDHRRSQDAMERTSAMMDELATTLVVGESKQGRNKKKGGIKVTFNGQRRPVSVEVDPSFLVSSSSGVISTAELNDAIMEAMQSAHEQSSSLMEKKISGLYESLGLPREPLSLDSKREDQK